MISRLDRCRRTARSASCRAAGGDARCSGRRWSPSRTCSCSTSQPTISTSTRSSGWRSICRFPGSVAFRHPRSRVPLDARDTHRGARSRHADVVARHLSVVPRKEGRGARERGERSRAGSTRSWRRKRRGSDKASRRAGRETRGASRTLMALRADRAAHRSRPGSVAHVDRPADELRPDGVRGEETSARLWRRAGHQRLLPAHHAWRPDRPDRPQWIREDDLAAASGRRTRTGRRHDSPRHAAAGRLLRPAARATRSGCAPWPTV